ncbi:phosphopantetheine-binding protein [Kitasatospora purpeofusca]|uniref:phosphopantetheine-binding protein n=1 Tax=Kitasatospora purpeofusca TaxID=67352 RepID=UPI002A5A10C8|nr:phosphopantetheine-binding protein [Kitasatospora purpeofusca]MDY0814805.1 phosphopantetheine-binding protein [Kitasatospora purpeofusca]
MTDSTATPAPPAAPPWDETFERLVQEVVEQFPPGGKLTADLDLPSAGLDSLAVIELLTLVEETYGVVLPDELLTFETFATPGTLWATISSLTPEGH